MKKSILLTSLLMGCMLSPLLASSNNPYVGRWALTLPSGGAGWLGIEEEAGQLKGSLLWGGGSVLPVDEVKIEKGELVVTRSIKTRKKQDDGSTTTAITIDTIRGKARGKELQLSTVKTDPEGKVSEPASFVGQRIADLPEKPDLSKLRYGKPISLFNGKNLDGWQSLNPNRASGWGVEDGVLVNRVKKGKQWANIRTEKEFEDFNLKTEVRTQANSNSGIYLRGIYEIQIAESYGKQQDSHFMGALYSRITPAVSAEKPIGEWQTLDITLVKRHLTVILNGKTIIDNEPVLGCTGGALWSDESKPGPIYLQGDHTNIDYRNMVLTPIL